jgi:hypothetical protein
MRRKGWLWFGSVQMAGVCLLTPAPSFVHYVGGFLLLPGSLLPLLLSATMKEPALYSTSFQLLVLIGGIIVNALSWRSVAKVVREQGLI